MGWLAASDKGPIPLRPLNREDPMTKPKQMTIKLTFEITYIPRKVSFAELKANLENMIDVAMGEGKLTGASPAEVVRTDLEIEVVE